MVPWLKIDSGSQGYKNDNPTTTPKADKRRGSRVIHHTQAPPSARPRSSQIAGPATRRSGAESTSMTKLEMYFLNNGT